MGSVRAGRELGVIASRIVARPRHHGARGGTRSTGGLDFELVRPGPSVAVLLALSLATGCADNEVGSYRLDQSLLLQASCSGTDLDRANLWSEALAVGPLETMQVGRQDGMALARSQAWFTRSDASVLYAEVTSSSDRLFEGLRELEATTVEAASLGADFAGLLESEELGCTFDMRLGITFSFEEDSWQEADGTMHLILTETAEGDQRCELLECRADFAFTATHVSAFNPGIFEPESS